MQDSQAQNFDPDEIEKFDALAARWWDPDGDFKPLHAINPARLESIAMRASPSGQVIDVGCGGGILTESMAAYHKDDENHQPGTVTGIDMAEKALSVARLHAMEDDVDITYQAITAEEMAQAHPDNFDTVTCLEMLEHVASYPSTVAACAELAKPGGHLFFSSINRTPKAYALLILGAEYVMQLLPRGTHDYAKFIKPAELCRAIRASGLEVVDISGMTYNPFSRQCRIGRDIDANYIVHATKPA